MPDIFKTFRKSFKECISRICEIRKSIQELQDKDLAVRNNMLHGLEQAFLKLPKEQALEFYKEIEESLRGLSMLKAVQSAFKRVFGRVPETQTTWTVWCSGCGKVIKVEFKSKQDFICQTSRRKRFYCNEKCKELEHQKHKKAEAERMVFLASLERLKTMPYKDYLQTDHWKGVRSKALRRANYRCQLCNEATKLNVHHRTYERRGKEDWNDVIALCEPCHRKHHNIDEDEE